MANESMSRRQLLAALGAAGIGAVGVSVATAGLASGAPYPGNSVRHHVYGGNENPICDDPIVGVTVQDFMSEAEIDDCKLDTPLLDHSTALINFFAFIQNNKCVSADCSGNFNLSQAIVLNAPKTDRILFDATIYAKGSGGDLLTLNQCNHIVTEGKLMLTTEATLYSMKTWNRGLVIESSSAAQFNWYLRAFGFKFWNIEIGNLGNNNSISLGSVRSQYGGSTLSQRSLTVTQVNTATTSEFTYSIDLNNESYKNLGFVITGGVYYPVISHDVMNKKIVTPLINGSKTSVQIVGFHVSRTFIARTDNPTTAAPSQRSIITLNEGVELPAGFERSDYVIVDSLAYRIMGYDNSTLQLTVYPRIKDYTKTTGLVHFAYGGGIRFNGADSNLILCKKLSLTGNAIGIRNNNFYSASMDSVGAEFNTIAVGSGVALTGVTKNNNLSNAYFEGNVFNTVDSSADTGVNVISNPIAWDWSKFKRLIPLGSTENNVTTYSKTGFVIVEDGATYKKQRNAYDGAGESSPTITLGQTEHLVVRGNTNTVSLKDDLTKRTIFGYVDIFFSVIGTRSNGTTDGATLTLKSTDGYTINGVVGDLVLSGARNALMVHARLISGNNWQVSIYKASYQDVVKSIDIPSIPANGVHTAMTTVGNALMGDKVSVSFDVDLQGLIVTASVSSAGNVRYTLYNPTAATIDLTSANVRFRLE
ncbi:hypothetical protein [Paenibacillus oceani]|uniref:Uncharacterized protein n=1 Tax=Paenibacillus oceani TaxID=2772510 RepID=A0A927CAU2_9BACL|nr:hypothetical protein [Paenibacillus oceani]MBD2863182.1 hypothetical protein [Paenibacillus oceani]